MQFLSTLFDYSYLPWIIFAVLVAVTMSVAWRWWLHQRRLKQLTTEIRGHLGFATILEIADTGERWGAFAAQQYDAQQALRTLANGRPLARQVLQFIDRCHGVQDEGSGKWRMETPTAPAYALDLSQHLLLSKVHTAFFRALPGTLVGLGLCITFAGLAVVIGNASHVLETANAGGSNEALRKLLVAASSKFWSSLTAVGCSIVYGMFYRRTLQKMAIEVSRLASELSLCVRVVTTDELQYEAVILLRKGERYQAETANTMGLLKSGLDHTQSSSADQHRMLLERLQGVADGLTNKLGDLGTELGAKFGAIGTDISQGLSQINEKAFADIVKQMTESLQQATEEHLKTIVERLGQVSETLGKLPDEFIALVGLVQDNTTAIAASFATAAKPIETSLTAASTSAELVAERFASLPDALEPARTAASELAGAANTISSMVGRIFTQNETLVTRWDELASLIQTLDGHLAGAVESVGGVFPSYAEKLQAFTSQWEAAMVKALGGLALSIQNLEKSHEDLREHRGAWRESADSVARGVEEVGAHVGQLTESLTGFQSAQASALASIALMLPQPVAETSTSLNEEPPLAEPLASEAA